MPPLLSSVSLRQGAIALSNWVTLSTIRQLQSQLLYCHPTVLIKTAWALRAALRGQGPTVFDWLVTLIKEHPNVELILVEGGE